MDADAPAPAAGGALRWRLWALVPAILLIGVVSATVAAGDSLDGLVGNAPPPADEFAVRRVEFRPGAISIHVTNPQRDDLTLAQVTVDDALVPFSVDGVQGARTLGRLESTTVSVPFLWVEDDPYTIGLISSTGIVTTHDVAAAVETEQASLHGAAGLAVIGVLVGIVPVALGLAWLPSLRRAAPRSLAAFMALTAGLLTFLMVEALAEALELQSALPGALNGTGLVVLGVASSYLGLTLVAGRLSGGGDRDRSQPLGGVGLATLVAIGIGVHNLGEGLAIGSSLALGELALGTFLIVGFMVHNVTEGLGIAAPVAEGAGSIGVGKLAALALVAGAPAVLGAWIGGFLTNDLLAVLFFAMAAGAALQVVVEVGRYVAWRAPGGLTSGHVVGGYLAGIAAMYATGLLTA
jgi:zinc transporter, ZIP family